MAILGEKFNNAYPDTIFIKLTNEAEIHNGFKFQNGLNIDHVPFDPSGSCKRGGIYYDFISNRYTKNIATSFPVFISR